MASSHGAWLPARLAREVANMLVRSGPVPSVLVVFGCLALTRVQLNDVGGHGLRCRKYTLPALGTLLATGDAARCGTNGRFLD